MDKMKKKALIKLLKRELKWAAEKAYYVCKTKLSEARLRRIYKLLKEV